MSSGRRVFWMASRSLSDGFPSRGGDGVMGLFEEASDCVGQHFGLLYFKLQAGVVKDCNDGNDGNCIGKGKLRVEGTQCLWRLVRVRRKPRWQRWLWPPLLCPIQT
jgi:hypothetical protein